MPRVLVIEDDEMLGMAISTVLQEKYEVSVFECPPTTEEMSNQRPDVLLLDFNAAPGGAVSLVNTVRSSPMLSNLPIVLMSGNHDAIRSDPVLETQCQAFLAKPFTMDKLSQTIDNMLQ